MYVEPELYVSALVTVLSEWDAVPGWDALAWVALMVAGVMARAPKRAAMVAIRRR